VPGNEKRGTLACPPTIGKRAERTTPASRAQAFALPAAPFLPGIATDIAGLRGFLPFFGPSARLPAAAPCLAGRDRRRSASYRLITLRGASAAAPSHRTPACSAAASSRPRPRMVAKSPMNVALVRDSRGVSDPRSDLHVGSRQILRRRSHLVGVAQGGAHQPFSHAEHDEALGLPRTTASPTSACRHRVAINGRLPGDVVVA